MKRGTPWVLLLWLLSFLPAPAPAETCSTGKEMDPATRGAIERAARQYFGYAAAGDVYRLRENSISSLAASFGGIEAVVIDQKAELAGAQPDIRATYLLEAPGNAPLARAEFLCGVWRMPEFAAFVLPNLPPGTYALVQLDTGAAGRMISMIFSQQAGAWKLAGYYSKPKQIAGKDGEWFLARAREYKGKGKNHNAWFYYLVAWDLSAPVDFMSTPKLDKLSEEMHALRPADLPKSGSPMDLAASGGRTFKITHLAAVPVKDELHVLVKYQVPDVSDSQSAFDSNVAVIKALLARYPEYRDAFAGVVARATEPSGRDYGTLLAMKDVK